MRVRHKPPTLVSMWMLDVFCCALGCVTLLWLLNTRQAGDQTAAAKSALEDLSASRKELLAARSEAEATRVRLNADAQKLTDQLAALQLDKDQLGRKLGVAQAEAKSAQELLDAAKLALNAEKRKLDTSAKELAAAAAKADDADDLLRKRQREADALAKKLAASAASADDLAKLLRKTDEERENLAKRAAELQARLDDADAKMRAAGKTATDAAAKAGGELAAARGAIRDLEKKLETAKANVIDLQGDKKALADKVDQLRKAEDTKFAGIAMTGKRVVFMVDMSGSMKSTDGVTEDPTKWPTVAETLGKVMRSIPGLERFQVLVFSSKARWLFGAGEWKAFEGETSAQEVRKALLAVIPSGDTNLHAAFELALGRRADGLDTIYLFSDGLPTSGPGLTAEQAAAKSLRETEKSELLAKHLRAELNTSLNRPAAGRPKVRVNAVGFFYESPDVGAFLWALARENDGSFVGMSRP